MRWLKQVWSITLFNLRNLRQRLGSSAVTILGVAGVVMVFVGILSIAAGFQHTLQSTGDPQNVLVMRAGSDTEMNSGLGLEATKIIADAPGILHGESGSLASAELFVVVDQAKKSTGTSANVPLRGIGPQAYEVRKKFEIVEGRRFEPGRNEVIVGKAAAAEFVGLEVGNVLRWGQNEWTVVGHFSTDGTVEDSELWTDARVLQPAYRRGTSFQSVRLRLESAGGFDNLKQTLTDDPRINVKVIRTSEYYASQASIMSGMIRFVGMSVGLLMGFGAIFGALNTMYQAVAARTREIATLRALGFSAGPVVVSVLVEALALAAIGGLLGGGLAYLLFNGFQAATLNFSSFSQVAFAFAVTPALIVGGLLYALAMGLIGGFFPAIRAARLPVATALREL